MSKAAAIQMVSTQDVLTNLKAAKNLLAQAASQGVQLAVLPEMFAHMGMDQSNKIQQSEQKGQGQVQDFLSEQAAQHKLWIVGGTIPLRVDHIDDKFHAACLVYNSSGQCVAQYNKIHLFDVKVVPGQEEFCESKLIVPGEQTIVIDTPIGKLGIAICYDLRFPELFRLLLAQGAEVIALPAAFTFTTGQVHWDILVRARAIENLSYLIAAGQGGLHEKERKTYGHSMVVSPWGEILNHLPQGPGVIAADISFHYLAQLRQNFPSTSHRRL